MSMHHKQKSLSDAISNIQDGASVMIGGFGVPGTPFTLIEELVAQGPKNLTVIKNDSNEANMGVDWLLNAGMVSTLITSHIGLNANAVAMKNRGELDVEFLPQGMMAEKIRAAGAGIHGFLTDVGIGTPLSEGKQVIEIAGEELIFEPALKADFALIHADLSDPIGNLVYKNSARNFNPIMAMAASRVIVETEKLCGLGEIDPNSIHTPCAFVDEIVVLDAIAEVYGIVKR